MAARHPEIEAPVTPRRGRCSVVVAALGGTVLVALLAAGCSGEPETPRGYEQVGTADGATLYAKREGSDRVSVILRSGLAGVVCNSSGPVVVGDGSTPPLALCDDMSPDTYSYVLPVPREGVWTAAATCDKTSGSPVPVSRVVAPTAWSYDFLVAVRPMPFAGITVCR